MDTKLRGGGCMRRRSSLFKWRIILLIWMIHAVSVKCQFFGKCPEKCFCHPYYHPEDGPSVRVECRIGGMNTIPVDDLDRGIHQLIIAPEPNDPNCLTIGPILTQPKPFSNLRDLTIANSNVPTIGQFSFWGLHNLRTLNLTGNAITSISMDNFRGLLNLNILELDSNHIEQMASETFRHMGLLTRLSLSRNHITTLVPRVFRMLGKLELLDLSDNPLHDLNPEVFKDIQNLLVLKCRKCLLRRINIQIYHIAPLIEELDLGDNLFKYLTDDDFFNLKKLKKLQLDNNQIAVVVDNAFRWNVQLEYLEISHNRIALLAPGCFNNLSDLSYLDISYNRLQKFRLQAFAPVTKSLVSINFSGNDIPQSEIAVLLQILPEIEELSLSNLSLKTIPSNFFMHNKRLMSLDISSNLLDQFPYKVLQNTKYLQFLDISRNKITSLNDLHLRRLEGIAKINLSPNPWNCDQCSVGPMIAYINTTVLNETIRSLRCHLPLRLRGLYLSDLNSELLETCFSSYEAQVSIIAGMVLVVMSVLATGAIALCLTRRRGAQYFTNEEKRRQRNHEHPEELLVSTNNGSVSTINSPYHHEQNNS